jgi:hypothetical protein
MVALTGCMAIGFAASASANKIPVCMIIDDAGPFLNAGTAIYPGEVDETPTSFYLALGQWAQASGVKGKMTVLPIAGGVAAVDGSLGEYPGHTQQERLDWIDTVKTYIEPRFTITPEIVTHLMPWDIVNSTPIANGQRENDYFAGLTIGAKADYIAYAMQRLKNAGFSCGGCTMCWSIPTEQDAAFGQATIEAMSRVYGPKDVMIFNDSFADPEVVYRSADGYAAVKTPPQVGDVDGVLYRQGDPTAERIEADASAMISADGQTGTFVDQIKRGNSLIFVTHIQSLYTNGRESGLEVYERAIERLNHFYGDDIEWMTAEQVADRVALATPEPSSAVLLAVGILAGLLGYARHKRKER